MKRFDREKPLVALHVPKTAGTTFRTVLKQWYGRNLYFHYNDPVRDKHPKKVRLKRYFSDNYRKGICIYGHFNKRRGFGVETYYPEIDQFITILREPFDRAVSRYFHFKTIATDTHRKIAAFNQTTLEEYLMTSDNNYLYHLPFQLNMINYKELLNKYFIHIGITEDMNTSVQIIAKKLGFKMQKKIKTLLVGKKDEKIPYHLKNEFIDKHQMEYAVYEFAKNNYDKL